MGIKDFIITPIYLGLFTILAIVIRPYVTTSRTRKYFLPALWVRFIGAIALGVIYQFYYGGGDTLNYWEHGSKWIWQALNEQPVVGIKMLLEGGSKWNPETFSYTNNIWYYKSPSSYAIVKITTVFDLFTLHTYSATALFFSVFSFSGLWALFTSLQKKYPRSNKLVLGILFFPSLIFWGSGILKDTITIGALGWMLWALIEWIEFRSRNYFGLVIFIIAFMAVSVIKLYVVLCLIPTIIIWLFLKYLRVVKSLVLRILIIPFLIIVCGVGAYLILQQITEGNRQYELTNLAERAKITAYDIRYGWGARLEGDGGYDLGELDGTWSNMVQLAPKAVVVSLFRPFPWEVRNPLMLLASLESIVILILVIRLFTRPMGITKIMKDPFLIFCLAFTILFSFAIGISSYNFGTLMRYKIPMIPLLLTFLLVNTSATNSNEKSILHQS
ncbi:hypothetical protein SAMN05421640_2028 [Ekhidna lutea]|uniref:Dolichyl-phosphate-mannose-protein mannosyltransferase n=1 Tax=Ekhidna lutea TaxID=447679 RepID=A0A239J8I3_EKHLU|nr:hypothetical protein [Ekhidna lutea]SNT01818.1 hypothetical protein SAMN05421640_2028 [Ekhidna lutea]